MRDKGFRQKKALVIKYALIWIMATVIIVIHACRVNGQGLSLSLTDFCMGFTHNPALLQSFKNKLILLSGAFFVLIFFTVFTEDFRLRLKLGKWKPELKPDSGILCWGSNLCLVAVAICFIWSIFSFVHPWMTQNARAAWEGDLLIAHACGGIDGIEYTNSVEAFENSYARGVRAMEVDLRLTSDDRLVCIHDWNDWAAAVKSNHVEDQVYSEEEFMGEQIFDRYTPMSLETLFELMREYEDVWIITDTKGTGQEIVGKQFEVMLETAQKTDSMDLLDRFVIQLYNYNMYDVVEEIHSFPSYILTLYAMGEPTEARFIKHCRFCKDRGIDIIIMWDEWVTPEIISMAETYGIDIYVHTVNDPDDMESFRDIGVKGFYTDYIFPKDLEE